MTCFLCQRPVWGIDSKVEEKKTKGQDYLDLSVGPELHLLSVAIPYFGTMVGSRTWHANFW